MNAIKPLTRPNRGVVIAFAITLVLALVAAMSLWASPAHAEELEDTTSEVIETNEPEAAPVVESVPEPIVETKVEAAPVVESVPEPITKPEPVVEEQPALEEATTEVTEQVPVVEPEPAPVVESVPEPVVEEQPALEEATTEVAASTYATPAAPIVIPVPEPTFYATCTAGSWTPEDVTSAVVNGVTLQPGVRHSFDQYDAELYLASPDGFIISFVNFFPHAGVKFDVVYDEPVVHAGGGNTVCAEKPIPEEPVAKTEYRYTDWAVNCESSEATRQKQQRTESFTWNESEWEWVASWGNWETVKTETRDATAEECPVTPTKPDPKEPKVSTETTYAVITKCLAENAETVEVELTTITTTRSWEWVFKEAENKWVLNELPVQVSDPVVTTEAWTLDKVIEEGMTLPEGCVEPEVPVTPEEPEPTPTPEPTPSPSETPAALAPSEPTAKADKLATTGGDQSSLWTSTTAGALLLAAGLALTIRRRRVAPISSSEE